VRFAAIRRLKTSQPNMSKIHQPGMARAVTLEGTQQGHRAVERNSTRDREFPLFANPESAPKSAETREGRRERHRRETFERLVVASREILFSRELDDVTVQDITEAADVGKGTFFNYFRSKEHMVSRLLVARQKNWDAAIDRVRSGQQSTPQVLVELARGYLLPESGAWLTYENNLMHALASVDVRAVLSEQVYAIIDAYETLMTLGQEQGTIRRDLSSRQLATFAHTFFAGFTVMLWIHGTPPTSTLVDETMSWLMKVLEPDVPTGPRRAPASRPGAKAVRRRVSRQRRTHKPR